MLYINSKVHVVDAGAGVAQKRQHLEKQKDDTTHSLVTGQADGTISPTQSHTHQDQMDTVIEEEINIYDWHLTHSP